MSVVKELRLKIRFVSHTAVEPLASVMLLLLCLRSTVLRQRKAPRYNVMVGALCTRQIGPGLCLEGDAVYELLLVPSLAPSDFSQGPAICPSPKKTSLLITNDQAALPPFFLGGMNARFQATFLNSNLNCWVFLGYYQRIHSWEEISRPLNCTICVRHFWASWCLCCVVSLSCIDPLKRDWLNWR